MGTSDPIRGPMPNFFVIGVNRAGTTSLHRYLGQHPDIFMSAVKEPSYFAPEVAAGDPLWPNQLKPVATLEEYLALFAGVTHERVIGESSAAYLTSRSAPRHLRAAVPHAKLVAVLRNPAERAFSDYCLHRSFGAESLSFAEAVSAELDHDGPVGGRMRGYVMTGFYGQSLTRYFEYFDRRQLRVYLYEDLQNDLDAMLRDLFAFLEVDPGYVVDTSARHNASRYEAKHRGLDRVLRWGPVHSLARRALPTRARIWARETLRRLNSVRPEFSEAVRQRLVELYRPDIELTARLIDRDLSAWLN
jgi:hypothetical protein